jgi:hypothetical protein
MTGQIEIGRLLRSSTTSFVVGCRINQLDLPSFGALVRAPLAAGYQVYGLIHDIVIADDGLVRQIVTADNVSPEVISDNRERRIVPVEISVLTIGYELQGRIHHSLPPRPPTSLDLIYLCDAEDLRRFASAGALGYVRLILGASDLPTADLLAAHVRQMDSAQEDSEGWRQDLLRELIAQLNDDYSRLTTILAALR